MKPAYRRTHAHRPPQPQRPPTPARRQHRTGPPTGPLPPVPELARRRPELSDAAVVSRSWAIAFATLVSRITGFGKIVLLAAILGAALASSYTVANQLPTLIAALVLEATFTAIFVPVLTRAEQSDPDGGAAFVRRLVTLVTALLLVATTLSVLAAPLLVRLMLGRNPQVNEALTTAFAYLLLPQVLAYGLTSVFMAILNTRNIFGPTAWAPVVNNVVAIATLGVYLAVPGELSVDPVRMGNTKLLVLAVGTNLGVFTQVAARAGQPAPAVGNRSAAQALRRNGRGNDALRCDQSARPGGRQPNRQHGSGFGPRDLQLHLARPDAAVRHDRGDGPDRRD